MRIGPFKGQIEPVKGLSKATWGLLKGYVRLYKAIQDLVCPTVSCLADLPSSHPVIRITDVLVDKLPGMPDGISRSADGGFWLALVVPLNPLTTAGVIAPCTLKFS